MKEKYKEALWAYLFILPQAVGILVFIVGAVIVAFLLSFCEWDLVTPFRWVGLRNYIVQLNQPIFWKCLLNTAYFALGHIPLVIIFGLGLALILHKKILGITVYRSVFFLPFVTSSVAISLVWLWLYNPEYGLINSYLSLVGIKGPQWIASLRWAMPSIIILVVWKVVGYNMVLFLAGLTAIPAHLYDAAKIDGAGRWTQFRYVTLPMLSPTIFFILIISIIGSLQLFDEVFIMTRGGPANATSVLVHHIYKLAFSFFKIGEASAVAWILFMLIFLVTLVQFLLAKRWVYYRGG